MASIKSAGVEEDGIVRSISVAIIGSRLSRLRAHCHHFECLKPWGDGTVKQNLVQATISGNVDDVSRLIEEGADINLFTYSGTPIQCAVKQNKSDIAKLLIEAGADVDAGSMLNTPLTQAIENQNHEIVLLLLKAGADPQLTSSLSNTAPLILAAINSSGAVIEALIEAGGDIDAVVGQVMHAQASAILQKIKGALETNFKLPEA